MDLHWRVDLGRRGRVVNQGGFGHGGGSSSRVRHGEDERGPSGFAWAPLHYHNGNKYLASMWCFVCLLCENLTNWFHFLAYRLNESLWQTSIVLGNVVTRYVGTFFTSNSDSVIFGGYDNGTYVCTKHDSSLHIASYIIFFIGPLCHRFVPPLNSTYLMVLRGWSHHIFLLLATLTSYLCLLDFVIFFVVLNLPKWNLSTRYWWDTFFSCVGFLPNIQWLHHH